jgi:hypothetical protein
MGMAPVMTIAAMLAAKWFTQIAQKAGALK